jgi:hypothetical protein
MMASKKAGKRHRNGGDTDLIKFKARRSKEQKKADLLSKMDVVANIKDIKGPEDLADLFVRAEFQRDARLATDPEHTEKKYWHKAELIRGFAAGVLAADPWYNDYRVPPNFERVLNRIAIAVDAWKFDEVVHASLQDLRQFFHATAMALPEFVAWNETDGPGIAFVSRDSPTPNHRSFIDLDAVFGNVINTLRNWKRDDERFETQFEKDHPEFRKPKGDA